MRIDIITVLPEMLEGFVHESILARAEKKGLAEIRLHNLRDYTLDKWRRVDDYPYGGSAGMVMQCEPIDRCISALKAERDYDEVIFTSPDGERFDQQAAVAAGDLPLADAPEVEKWLRERLASVAGRGWFAPQAKALCEASILAPDGLEYRPDRVIIHPDGHVDVVDYKFGHPEERYQWQVRRYVSLYRRMGHEKVAGYLWYLEENRVQDV